jgi:hypothetical protein
MTTEFDVQQNLLTGRIPTELAQCSKMLQLLLTFNDLTGAVPSEVCAMFTPVREGYDISVDCDEVECSCNCTCGAPYETIEDPFVT